MRRKLWYLMLECELLRYDLGLYPAYYRKPALNSATYQMFWYFRIHGNKRHPWRCFRAAWLSAVIDEPPMSPEGKLAYWAKVAMHYSCRTWGIPGLNSMVFHWQSAIGRKRARLQQL